MTNTPVLTQSAPATTRRPAETRPGVRAVGRSPVSGDTGQAGRGTTGEDRYRMIAEAAYFRAEQRGFAPGDELADWLAAELDIDALLQSYDEHGRD